MTEVRTRFAPSPTGLLHIGGFRSAIYAWLLARHHNGRFILRIEDTDQTRKVPGSIRYIMEAFEWFGLDIDEGPTPEELAVVDDLPENLPQLGGTFGPYVQSLRLSRYQEIAEKLIAEGHAFRCDCTPEMLDKEREEQRARKETTGYAGRCRDRNVSKDTPHVVRFRMPENLSLSIEDGVRGNITWDSVPLRDPVILKTDGYPTYHLAVVCDDHDMHISHAMRGEEWIPSAPLHVLIYKALGWDMPIFCHLPVVLGPDGKKLSKRHGAVSWSIFRDEGFLPEALLNFIVRIGWSPGSDEQEIFSKDDLIARFSLKGVNPASAVFEYTKLEWMNGVYIRNLSDEALLERLQPFLKAQEMTLAPECWRVIAPHVKERLKRLDEVPELVSYLTSADITHDVALMLKKGVDKELALKILAKVLNVLSAQDDFSEGNLEAVVKPLAEELGLKMGQIFNTLRVAVTGGKSALPLFPILAALGKERVLQRVGQAVVALEG